MTRIKASHITQASKRLEDFYRVGVPRIDPAVVKEARDRINGGEDPRAVLGELKRHAPYSEMDAAMHRQRQGLGLTEDAHCTFTIEMTAHEPGEFLSREEAVEQAAYSGLIIGLTAQQLAEDQGKEPS